MFSGVCPQTETLMNMQHDSGGALAGVFVRRTFEWVKLVLSSGVKHQPNVPPSPINRADGVTRRLHIGNLRDEKL